MSIYKIKLETNTKGDKIRIDCSDVNWRKSFSVLKNKYWFYSSNEKVFIKGYKLKTLGERELASIAVNEIIDELKLEDIAFTEFKRLIENSTIKGEFSMRKFISLR